MLAMASMWTRERCAAVPTTYSNKLCIAFCLISLQIG